MGQRWPIRGESAAGVGGVVGVIRPGDMSPVRRLRPEPRPGAATPRTAIDACRVVPNSTCASGHSCGRFPAGTTPANTLTAPRVDTAPVGIAIWWALQQLGTPYTFGGDCTDPYSGNPAHQCDCSSLVQQAYRAGGITLPRVTDDQQHAGTPVPSLADIRPGDLIFIPGADGSLTDPGHVGLYIGQGLLVQAPHTGDVVKITKVAAWANQVATIRRVVA